MEQLFTTIQYRLKDKKIQTFMTFLEERKISQYDDFFLFDRTQITKVFTESLHALASDITLTDNFLQDNHAEIISMTIDGDFLLGNDTTTFVVEKTLIVADIETYDLPMIDFFVAYEQGSIPSNILPTVDAPENTTEEMLSSQPDKSEKEKEGFFTRLFGKHS